MKRTKPEKVLRQRIESSRVVGGLERLSWTDGVAACTRPPEQTFKPALDEIRGSTFRRSGWAGSGGRQKEIIRARWTPCRGEEVLAAR